MLARLPSWLACAPAYAAALLCWLAAGGWLGRAFIGQEQYKDGASLSADTLGSGDLEPHPAVRALVTLGTPHSAPPPDKVRRLWLLLRGIMHACVTQGRADPERTWGEPSDVNRHMEIWLSVRGVGGISSPLQKDS